MSELDFNYGQDELKQTAASILDLAIKLGATNAQVEINEGIATEVGILNANIENFETSYDSSLALTVYIGQKRGSIGISQAKPQQIENMINRALDIAKYTQPDNANGLPENKFICSDFYENLSLYNPHHITNTNLIQEAQAIEDCALSLNKAISQSDGSSIGLIKSNFVIANSNGLNLGYQTTRYSNSISLIGNTKSGMQTDYWYDTKRDFKDLLSATKLANIAVNRVARRLNKGKVNPGIYPVIFESPIAKSLIASFLGAISGGNLYRRLSFLNDSINTQVFPKWMEIEENPFLLKGSSSCYFDNEGVMVIKRDLVKAGIVQGYILSSYSARKLGMETTGNAGGYHNITVKPNFSGDIEQLAQTMEQGLIVIETIGHGLNMVTGDYSVGASGLWVENGKISHFADNLTISGNLKQIFNDIRYISDDTNPGSILCGSILVDKINISA